MAKDTISTWIESHSSELIKMSDQIWDLAELGLNENGSADLQAKLLEANGFKIDMGIAMMPSAFVATWGSGRPVVALLGEYDALPKTSNRAVPWKEELLAGGSGHACGHNLLGMSAVGGAMAAKAEMERLGIKGTIKYFGCPAEENAGGKIYMVRAGYFDDVDVALTWHPSSLNRVSLTSSLANRAARFRFHGLTAHAAGDPENGRSALDAVELMNVGVNYLREHMMEKARIHYVITNGGGAPNVVPDVAESWYYIRAPKAPQAKDLYERVVRIARGAAMMTDTELEIRAPGGVANVVSNLPLAEAIHKNMSTIGATVWTGEDIEWAKKITEHFPKGQRQQFEEKAAEMGYDVSGKHLHDFILPIDMNKASMGGSTDVGDVSWVTPTQQFAAACSVLGSAGHSWQITAASGANIGHMGMLQAAKILGLTTMDVMTDPSLVARAREYFNKEKGAHEYQCAVPPEVKAPTDPFAKSE